MLEKLLAAEVLVIGVLDPALAQHLVGEVVGVLEDRQPRHQSCRQRWLAGAVRVDRSELLFQKAPVDRSRQLRQRMLHIDDLVEPRTKQILLAALPTLPWPHRILRSSLPAAGNHDARFEGIPNINLQEKRPSSSNCRQIQSQQFPQFLLPLNRFGIFHGSGGWFESDKTPLEKNHRPLSRAMTALLGLAAEKKLTAADPSSPSGTC